MADTLIAHTPPPAETATANPQVLVCRVYDPAGDLRRRAMALFALAGAIAGASVAAHLGERFTLGALCGGLAAIALVIVVQAARPR